MQDSLEDVAYTVGGALVSPGPGSGELLIALLVACFLAFTAFHALFAKHGSDETGWKGRR
ncbi:hypothetical protein [Microvirga terricola]|uniref:Uncharacterized protein n=1 Tax=Microvirga terricola TaxID=2719797 RepID=A0ABX0V9L3_9HYPH|nr:hypothetical protein [Microvirga terricola]NIX76248.1 hypothetical protein [Microvirga terricola]